MILCLRKLLKVFYTQLQVPTVILQVAAVTIQAVIITMVISTINVATIVLLVASSVQEAFLVANAFIIEGK